MRRRKLFNSVPRKVRSWMLANIILSEGLFDEWKVYCYLHPKIKSKYRLANLFLLNKKKRFMCVDNPIKGITIDTLEDYYYG